MNFKQFRLLALFVTIAAASNAIAQSVPGLDSIPTLNSPQSINAEAQQITSSLNAGGQELNTNTLNIGQNIAKFGYGPLREFGTDAGQAVESKLDPYSYALEQTFFKVKNGATDVSSELASKVTMFTSVAKNGFSTFVSEAQSALANTPVGQNAFVEQATQSVATQLGMASQTASASSDGSAAASNQALQKAAKKYVAKMRTSPQFADAGATSNGISYLLTTVLFGLSTVDQGNPLSSLPVHRRQDPLSAASGLLSGASADGSGSSSTGLPASGVLSSIPGLSSINDEINQYSQNQNIVGLQNTIPQISSNKRQLPTDNLFDGSFPDLDGDDSDISDSGFTSSATPDNVSTGSPDDSLETNANKDVNAKGPGGLATVPDADVPVIAGDGSNVISVKRRMQHKRRALLN